MVLDFQLRPAVYSEGYSPTSPSPTTFSQKLIMYRRYNLATHPEFEESGVAFCSAASTHEWGNRFVAHLLRTITSFHELYIKYGHVLSDESERQLYLKDIEELYRQRPDPTLEYDERCRTCKLESSFKGLAEFGPTSFIYLDTALVETDSIDNPARPAGFERSLIGLTQLKESRHFLSFFHLTGTGGRNEQSTPEFVYQSSILLPYDLSSARKEKIQQIEDIFKTISEKDEDVSHIQGLALSVLNAHLPQDESSSFAAWSGESTNMMTRAATALVDVLEAKANSREYPEDFLGFVSKVIRLTDPPPSGDTETLDAE